jgi:hypothetical protein
MWKIKLEEKVLFFGYDHHHPHNMEMRYIYNDETFGLQYAAAQMGPLFFKTLGSVSSFNTLYKIVK